MLRRGRPLLVLGGLLALAGCQWFVNDADKQVYNLIEQREQEALGARPDATIDKEIVPKHVPPTAYDYVPSATQPTVPEEVRATSRPTTQPLEPPTTQAIMATGSRPADVLRMSLDDALRYAFLHARQYQTAKEDLYLSALALTLERYLWGPRFMGTIRTEYANYGQIRDFDHAMRAVADVAVQQRLPYGGEVTASVINTLMRDLGRRITSNESGQAILEANVPLLRGAGTAARETRYQAERNLIYATRAFERFRRTFAVDVAKAFVELLLRKREIENAKMSYRSFRADAEQSDALFRAGKIIELDAQRAAQRVLTSWNQVLGTVEAYERQLDQFKILLGMPTTQPLDIYEKGLDIRVPTVGDAATIEIGLANRLDLINNRDAIDDARRGVKVARNNLLPDLNLRGNVTFDTNPNELNQFHYEHERVTWRGFMDLELPLDRLEERNEYRASLIDLRRAQRRYDLAADQVRLEIRRAKREMELAVTSLSIQRENMVLAQDRREAADFRFRRGLIRNRDVVEAEDALLEARDAYARAEARLRQAILDFYLNAGMIRVNDEGKVLDFRAESRYDEGTETDREASKG